MFQIDKDHGNRATDNKLKNDKIFSLLFLFKLFLRQFHAWPEGQRTIVAQKQV